MNHLRLDSIFQGVSSPRWCKGGLACTRGRQYRRYNSALILCLEDTEDQPPGACYFPDTAFVLNGSGEPDTRLRRADDATGKLHSQRENLEVTDLKFKLRNNLALE